MTTIRQALNETLVRHMSADQSVIVMGEDIAGGDSPESETAMGGCFGVTAGLYEQFGPTRVMNMPISETAFMGMAVGAAMTGMRPVVEIMFCDFMGVCFDQLINQAAKTHFLSGNKRKIPLVIRTTFGAGDGSAAMHSQSLYGLLMQVSGLTVAVPATASEAAAVLDQALTSDGPTVIFEHKALYDIGDMEWIADGGADCTATIVAVGNMAHEARRAQTELKTQGITVDVVNPVQVAPLDIQPVIKSLQHSGHLIVVDEGSHMAGFADAVISAVTRHSFDRLKSAPIALTPPDTPVPYAKGLEAKWLPKAADIIEAVKQKEQQYD